MIFYSTRQRGTQTFGISRSTSYHTQTQTWNSNWTQVMYHLSSSIGNLMQPHWAGRVKCTQSVMEKHKRQKSGLTTKWLFCWINFICNFFFCWNSFWASFAWHTIGSKYLDQIKLWRGTTSKGFFLSIQKRMPFKMLFEECPFDTRTSGQNACNKLYKIFLLNSHGLRFCVCVCVVILFDAHLLLRTSSALQ